MLNVKYHDGVPVLAVRRDAVTVPSSCVRRNNRQIIRSHDEFGVGSYYDGHISEYFMTRNCVILKARTYQMSYFSLGQSVGRRS